MATLTIRDVPEETRQALKRRAAHHNRSMEAEVREILQTAVRGEPDFVTAWLDSASLLRGEFVTPQRSPARPVDLR